MSGLNLVKDVIEKDMSHDERSELLDWLYKRYYRHGAEYQKGREDAMKKELETVEEFYLGRKEGTK